MATALAVAALVLGAAACGNNPKAQETRGWSEHYAFRIAPAMIPPRALEPIRYRIIVQDKVTRQPIENGEGRIFANSQDGAGTNDGFQKEKELGAYSARLFFPTTGDWAIAIQFRGDTNPHTPLERIDWVQAVLEGSEPGK